jgi:hypothetical protein
MRPQEYIACLGKRGSSHFAPFCYAPQMPAPPTLSDCVDINTGPLLHCSTYRATTPCHSTCECVSIYSIWTMQGTCGSTSICTGELSLPRWENGASRKPRRRIPPYEPGRDQEGLLKIPQHETEAGETAVSVACCILSLAAFVCRLMDCPALLPQIQSEPESLTRSASKHVYEHIRRNIKSLQTDAINASRLDRHIMPVTYGAVVRWGGGRSNGQATNAQSG